jgi:hypothetical protein
MRATLITSLGALGDEAVIAEAQRRVRVSQTDPSVLPAAIRNAVLGVYAQNATLADYEALLTQLRAGGDFVEQRRMWLRLASAKDNSLAQRTLQMVLTDQIPRQVRPQVLQNVAIAHPRLAWDFLVQNRQAIEGMLDPLQRLEFPTGVASQSSDPAVADALREYARDFPEGAQPTVNAAAGQIELKAQTIRERMPAVESWIRVHPPGGERRS